jgi:hypothetical protein
MGRVALTIACGFMAAACTAEVDVARVASHSQPLTTELRGIVTDELGEPLADVGICALGLDEVPCAWSDGHGNYRIELPANEALTLSFEHRGYWSKLSRMTTGDDGHLEFRMSAMESNEWLQHQIVELGWLPRLDQGVVRVSLDGLEAGATFLLDPAVDNPPVYFDDDGVLDAGRLTTSAAGSALFFEVPAGNYDAVVFSPHKGADCVPEGELGAQPNAGRLVAMPGHLSEVRLSCSW